MPLAGIKWPEDHRESRQPEGAEVFIFTSEPHIKIREPPVIREPGHAERLQQSDHQN